MKACLITCSAFCSFGSIFALAIYIIADDRSAGGEAAGIFAATKFFL